VLDVKPALILIIKTGSLLQNVAVPSHVLFRNVHTVLGLY